MSITELTSRDAQLQLMQSPKCVIFFGSAHCGHCMKMGPIFSQLASQYRNTAFGHVEVSNLKVDNLGPGVPVFVFYRNGEPFDKVVGADEKQLRAKLAQL